MTELVDLPTDTDGGQYVLTAKKIDGDITYTWVKMDLINEGQNKQNFTRFYIWLNNDKKAAQLGGRFTKTTII